MDEVQLELIQLHIAHEMTNKMEDGGFMDNISAATNREERLKQLEAAEVVPINVMNEMIREDADMDETELAAFARIQLSLMNHNYEYFGFPEKAVETENATDGEMLKAIADIKENHGIVDRFTPKQSSEEEVFVYDSLEK